jgi:hypothetical protein
MKVWFVLLVFVAINCIKSVLSEEINSENNEIHKLLKRASSASKTLVGQPAPEWWKSWWR